MTQQLYAYFLPFSYFQFIFCTYIHTIYFKMQFWLYTLLLKYHVANYRLGFPGGSALKNLPASVGDTGDMALVPGSGRSTWRRNGNPLQYSYLENPMDRGAWWATVHEVAKSWTRLKRLSMRACSLAHPQGDGIKGISNRRWGPLGTVLETGYNSHTSKSTEH